MKEKVGEKNETYPENPPWTMFFDGPLYQEYDKFMKTKDFSQILLNTKLRLANNSQNPEAFNPAYTIDEEHWNKEQDADPTGSTYQYVTEDYYHRRSEDEKRRTRRTRAFIIISLVIMAALAFGTALVVHYIFIVPSEEPKRFLNVSIDDNITTTHQPEVTTTVPIGDHTDNKPLLLGDLLKGHTHGTEGPSPHDHDPHDHGHGHILNTDGKIFDDTDIVTTEASTTDVPETTTMPTSEASISTTTAVYVLNLNPYPKPDSSHVSDQPKNESKVTTTTRVTHDVKKPKKDDVSTTHNDHMDFFGMDEIPTTTEMLNTSLSDADFFGIDDYFYDDQTTSKPNTTETPSVTETIVTVSSNSVTDKINKTVGVSTTISAAKNGDVTSIP